MCSPLSEVWWLEEGRTASAFSSSFVLASISSFSAFIVSTSPEVGAPKYCLMKSRAFAGFSGSSYSATRTWFEKSVEPPSQAGRCWLCSLACLPVRRCSCLADALGGSWQLIRPVAGGKSV